MWSGPHRRRDTMGLLCGPVPQSSEERPYKAIRILKHPDFPGICFSADNSCPSLPLLAGVNGYQGFAGQGEFGTGERSPLSQLPRGSP